MPAASPTDPFTIRPLESGEERLYLDLIKKVVTESQYLLREVEEVHPDDPDEQARVRSVLEGSSSIILVAEDKGEFVGFAVFHATKLVRERHVCRLALAVRSAWQKKGIGTALFKRGEAWCKENGICRIEFTVVTENKEALSLYQKLGCEIEGTRRMAMVVDARYVDEYYMAKLLLNS